MQSAVLEALQSGALLLTANRRLQRVARAAFDAAQLAAGRSVWEPARILLWSDWVERCWRELSPASGSAREDLLSDAEELLLWERVIASSAFDRAGDQPDIQALLDIPATARAARHAWQLSHAWALDLTSTTHPTIETEAFTAWAVRVQKRCRAHGWITAAELPARLTRHLAAVALPARVLLQGFDFPTPQLLALVDALRQAGSQVEFLAPGTDADRCRRVACPDPETELRQAAHWSRRLLETGAAAIGIVVPDLGSRRAQVERIFSDVLYPGRAPSDEERCFNISLGRPLAGYPIIAAALQLLGGLDGPLDLMEVGLWLRSPFLGGAKAERGPRALLDAELRRHGESPLSLARLAAKAAAARCPQLQKHIDAALKLVRHRPQQQWPSEWVAAFDTALDALGWPGERGRDSAEFQTLEAWTKTLRAFSRLETVLHAEHAPLRLRDALAHLRRLAADTIFQPETGAAPIQVLGLLEAAGLQFSHLWVTGLHDTAWPPPAQPNPFLPRDLQRQHGLPASSAAQQMHFATQFMQGWRTSAPEVVLSYPQHDEEAERRPSPLLPAGPELELEPLSPHAVAWTQPTATLLAQDDSQGPPVVAEDGVALQTGGAKVLSEQAACPFRAFAALRLRAEPLVAVTPGLNAKQQGTVTHAFLARLWAELGGSTALDEPYLTEKIEVAARAALEKLRLPALRHAPLRALEQKRLVRLAQEWLVIEKQRQPFTVAGCEVPREVTVGGLTLHLKVDRVDRLSDGSEVLLDYKSGKVSAKAWDGERPEEPQLPLYAITHAAQPAGFALAQLRLGEMKFVGAQGRDGVFPKCVTSPDWEAQCQKWGAVLGNLAADFARGEAAVDPRDGSKTCEYCTLRALCRVADGGALAMDGDEAGDDEDGEAADA